MGKITVLSRYVSDYSVNESKIFRFVIYLSFFFGPIASQCPPLTETSHANATVLNGGGRSYGTIIRFECEPGFVRNGHPVLLCMSNGTWSSPVPTCTRKCPLFRRLFNMREQLHVDK